MSGLIIAVVPGAILVALGLVASLYQSRRRNTGTRSLLAMRMFVVGLALTWLGPMVVGAWEATSRSGWSVATLVFLAGGLPGLLFLRAARAMRVRDTGVVEMPVELIFSGMGGFRMVMGGVFILGGVVGALVTGSPVMLVFALVGAVMLLTGAALRSVGR